MKNKLRPILTKRTEIPHLLEPVGGMYHLPLDDSSRTTLEEILGIAYKKLLVLEAGVDDLKKMSRLCEIVKDNLDRYVRNGGKPQTRVIVEDEKKKKHEVTMAMIRTRLKAFNPESVKKEQQRQCLLDASKKLEKLQKGELPGGAKTEAYYGAIRLLDKYVAIGGTNSSSYITVKHKDGKPTRLTESRMRELLKPFNPVLSK